MYRIVAKRIVTPLIYTMQEAPNSSTHMQKPDPHQSEDVLQLLTPALMFGSIH